MKQVFETKLTVRIYSTKLIEKLNAIMNANPNRYQSRNQLLVELLELGVKEKLKDMPVAPQEKRAEIMSDDTELLKQLKTLVEEMQVYNRQHVEGLLAHFKMSERLSSAVYNLLVAISTDEPVSKVQIEKGYFDDVPLRFLDFLNGLLSLLKVDEEGQEEDGENEDDEGGEGLS